MFALQRSPLLHGTVFLLLFLCSARYELSWAGVSCHCFRDRAFDPRAPAASDPYLLATTQNSLLSVVYGIDKNQVVRRKMGGTPGTDLWIAHRAASNRDLTAGELLRERSHADSWAALLKRRGVDPGSWLQDPASAPPDAALAAAVVDDVLVRRLGATRADVQSLRRQGATDAEVILATYLARRGSGEPPSRIYRKVKDGEASWSGRLHAVGGVPEGVEEDLRERLQ